MENTIKYAGLIGCGDYLRWLIDGLNSSKVFKVKSTFDLDKKKSLQRANELNANSVADISDIFNDASIHTVLIFTPPYARYSLFEMAVKSGKHIITTKPLANNATEAKKLLDLVQKKVKCSVHYGRTGNANVEMLKKIFSSGEIGQLAFYKEDWMHHYPTWNSWATDREKNGGPFMDAMVHCLNKARYLIGEKAEKLCYFSDNYAQNLKCNDTESLKIDFTNNASAQLFITWAADLEVFDPTGNDREHYGITHYITNQGWYVKETEKDGVPYIRAHKNNQVKEWKVEPLQNTPYDQFIIDVEAGLEPEPSLEMAYEDILIMNKAANNVGRYLEI